MKKMLTVLTTMFLIIVLSSAVVMASCEGYGSISFKPNFWGKEKCTTSISIQNTDVVFYKYFIGAEVWNGNSRVADNTKGWSERLTSVSDDVSASAEGTRGYGLYVALKTGSNQIITWGSGFVPS